LNVFTYFFQLTEKLMKNNIETNTKLTELE